MKQMVKQKQYILGFKVNKTFWILFHKANYFSTILSVILRLFIKNGSHGWRASCIWTVNFKGHQEVELRSIKGAFWCLRKFLQTESPLIILKNASHLKYSSCTHDNFYLRFLVMSKNDLIRKIRLISKFMTSQPG